MSSPAQVLVVIPARDEEESILTCLDRVLAAAAEAVRAGAADRVRVAVAAHRCTDQTARRAAGRLRAAGVDHLVHTMAEECPVGRVRTRLATLAVAAGPPLDLERGWLFSTDADSEVPPDWITAMLAAASAAQADLVAGLTDLLDWRADPAAVAAYADLLAAGLLPGGEHRHVYAANLAVRLPVFRRVGGFPAVPHGEERELVAAVQRSGGRVLSTLYPVVRTSARMPGRAPGGLGSLLAGLAGAEPAPPEGVA